MYNQKILKGVEEVGIQDCFLNTIKEEFIETFINFPNVNNRVHTMAYAIDLFCTQKLPKNIIKKYVKQGYMIDVLGVYPEVFETYFMNLGYKDILNVNFINNPKIKKYNFVRPNFYICRTLDNQKKIVISVTPGMDYIKHYVSIIIHYLRILKVNYLDIVKIYRYPDHEKYLTEWTMLDDTLVSQNDTLILGNIEDTVKSMKSIESNMMLINTNENDFYRSERYKMSNGIVVNFFGVKYSYWGNISKIISEKLLELGVSEIIYTAKLGSLISHDTLYTTIFSPTSYVNYDYINKTKNTFTLENKFAEMFPEFDTGKHCSVPTILEQNYYLRQVLLEEKVNSIDNEISQMAQTIYEFNNMNNKDVSFFAVHFATDYVRTFEEKNLKTSYDLSNNRTDSARLCKNNIINEISGYLLQYLKNKNIGDK